MNDPNQNKESDKLINDIDKTIPDKRNPITFQQLEDILGKWLLIKDRGIIKVVLATVIANKLQADPVWLFIVAASGGTKTELIRGLNKVFGVYPISDLTPQTFLSGEKGQKNASLLLRLPAEDTILTYKDFTTVLTMHRDKRHAILSQLREIYDGYYRKEFGTGETKTWEGKMGFIAGVTSVIDNHQAVFQVLGERFVQYRPEQPDAVALAKKAMANSGDEKKMREEIQNAFADFIAGINIPNTLITTSEDFKDRIAHLASFCVRARSGVLREGYSSREIELIPDPELPTRLAKQMTNLLYSLNLITNSPEENYQLVYKIGMDSLPQKRRRVVNVLIEKSKEPGIEVETAEVAVAIDYPTNTTRRILEDLYGLRLVNRVHSGLGHADRWRISDEAKDLWEKAQPKLPEEKEVVPQAPADNALKEAPTATPEGPQEAPSNQAEPGGGSLGLNDPEQPKSLPETSEGMPQNPLNNGETTA